MSAPWTVLQLSDCHLWADPDAHYRDQSPDANLTTLMRALKTLKPNGVVLTGDLAEDGSQAAYERVVQQLQGLCDRVAWIPGNHDDVEVMTDVLGSAGHQRGPILQWGGWQIILLNSVIPEDPAGYLSDDQLMVLEEGQKMGGPALVFLHHPPMPVGSAWIDRYPLREPHRLFDALDHEVVKAVGFGHVHQAYTEVKDHIHYFSAPATSVNSQPGFPQFTVDPTGPKARWYKLWPDGRWMSGVVSAG